MTKIYSISYEGPYLIQSSAPPYPISYNGPYLIQSSAPPAFSKTYYFNQEDIDFYTGSKEKEDEEDR